MKRKKLTAKEKQAFLIIKQKTIYPKEETLKDFPLLKNNIFLIYSDLFEEIDNKHRTDLILKGLENDGYIKKANEELSKILYNNGIDFQYTTINKETKEINNYINIIYNITEKGKNFYTNTLEEVKKNSKFFKKTKTSPFAKFLLFSSIGIVLFSWLIAYENTKNSHEMIRQSDFMFYFVINLGLMFSIKWIIIVLVLGDWSRN